MPTYPNFATVTPIVDHRGFMGVFPGQERILALTWGFLLWALADSNCRPLACRNGDLSKRKLANRRTLQRFCNDSGGSFLLTGVRVIPVDLVADAPDRLLGSLDVQVSGAAVSPAEMVLQLVGGGPVGGESGGQRMA